jgi:hypothetical protein
MSEEATREGVAFADHREDPTTGFTAQDFWRRRSTSMLINELSPYHVHEKLEREPKSITVGGYLP